MEAARNFERLLKAELAVYEADAEFADNALTVAIEVGDLDAANNAMEAFEQAVDALALASLIADEVSRNDC